MLFEGKAVLRLTDNQRFRTGTAFQTEAIPIRDAGTGAAIGFSTVVQFRMSEPNGWSDNDGQGADGIVFVVARSPNVVGGSGLGIGYAGIANSLGVEFDSWNNGSSDGHSGNHQGFNANGSSSSFARVHVPGRFNDGQVWTAWIDYDGASQLLEVRVVPGETRPEDATLATLVDIPALLGQDEGYFGFTSATGRAMNAHDLITWGIQSDGLPGEFTGPDGDFSNLVRNGDDTHTRSYPNGVELTFDAAGLLAQATNANQETTTYGYDAEGRITSITDSEGRVTSFAYGVDGRLETSRDAAGRTTSTAT